jgi:RimJ/RimL family protein N-acetyltransferase
MRQDIEYILSTFTASDKLFMDATCIFRAPIYRQVISKDDLPIAFVEAKSHHNDLYINIGVVPHMRGQGYAATLARKLIGWFSSTKYSAIRWNTHEDNVQSIKLAKKLGFKEFSVVNQDPGIRYFALGNKPD